MTVFGKKPDVFESVISEVVSTASASSGDNLTGFVYDAEHYLSENEVLVDVSVRRTAEPRCLLVIDARVTDKATTLQDVASTLREAWVSLAYAEFEASSCAWYREATLLRFVTVMSGPRLFVTGRVIASGGPYDRLVERFVREFGELHGPLDSVPKTLAE